MEVFKGMAFLISKSRVLMYQKKISAFQDPHFFLLNTHVVLHENFIPIAMSIGEETPTTSMMTSSNGNIFRVTGHLCGEFTGPPVNSPHKGQ